MKGGLDLDVGHIWRWFTCPQTVTYPSSNMVATRLGVKPTTSQHRTITPPSQL